MIAKTQRTTPAMSNFWTGFTVGATVLFFLGTKKGRSALKQIMDFAEHLENNIDDIVESAVETKTNKNKLITGATNITDLISKIQSALPEKRDISKFFVKNGKTLKSA
ncbi:hypothetical protein A2690_04105 [Candidatus Roizmanbacteria bacterium RIFCSPHIGHO2_01_FULL_39_12b]|uniref:YtxH domain-containing protein n=1 Tax=Candidatus Roizmanbacteria bacterium RIFCSPHIGHO2_01_FULL_39_12b TaxID=1802030 RepID=A0A1F7GCJ7_9BACT|nr:MAG: hypothetical protein A2690_04105 [Candidatus Roizmanbacteria bacterium RIFCSPHIGHO2_01_FULL_39_12b]OGK47125.1 MAG: hypothetical protein A3B46_01830 [Candidatus Roizmanbacteria bacterium RIFCSPLOWO2_01_FULL_39_19]